MTLKVSSPPAIDLEVTVVLSVGSDQPAASPSTPSGSAPAAVSDQTMGVTRSGSLRRQRHHRTHVFFVMVKGLGCPLRMEEAAGHQEQQSRGQHRDKRQESKREASV